MIPLFEDVTKAMEEVALNSLFTTKIVSFSNGLTVKALPIKKVKTILKKYR